MAIGATTLRGGEFVISPPESVFTPEDFSPDERMMGDTALLFSKREVLPIVERLDEQEEGLMVGLVKKACELGFGGPDTPEKYGGLGLSKSVAARVLEMLSLNGSFSTTIGVHQGVGQVPLSLFGSEYVKGKYLPRIISGDCIAAYALSEPNSGSDALSLATKATLDASSNYRLSGTKMWISNAKWAGTFVVFAKVDGERVSAFVVEREFPGVIISREEHKMGLKGSSTARLILEDVPVPRENLLYEEGLGHKVAFNTLNIGRCKLAAMALGQMRSALHVATRYAKERKQFGRPIAEFGLIRDKLTRSAALMYASESMLYRTSGLLDGAFSRVDPGASDVIEQHIQATQEYQVECAIVKVFATEALAYIVDEALQIHGGYGFTEEFPVARLYRDARVMRIYEGTNEINRLFIFDRIKKRWADQLVSLQPTSTVHDYLLRGAAAAKTDETSQELVAALSDLAIHLYALQSVRLRTDAIRQSGHDFWSVAQAMADCFESMCNQRAADYLSEVMGRCGSSAEVQIPSVEYSTRQVVAEAVLEADGYPL